MSCSRGIIDDKDVFFYTIDREFYVTNGAFLLIVNIYTSLLSKYCKCFRLTERRVWWLKIVGLVFRGWVERGNQGMDPLHYQD